MTDFEFIWVAFPIFFIGFSVGYLRAQKRYIPEIAEAREETVRVQNALFAERMRAGEVKKNG